jgi:hypothetical protein
MCTGLGMFEICAYNYRSLVEAINRSSNWSHVKRPL